MISYFNDLRAQGLPLHEAIMQGAAKRVRPVMMTALTAILGLLPAALACGPPWMRPIISPGSSRSAPRRSGRWPSSSSAA